MTHFGAEVSHSYAQTEQCWEDGMEFSYRISEAEYLRATRPKSKRTSSYIKAILFWLFIIAFLVLLLTVVPHYSMLSGVTRPPAVQPESCVKCWTTVRTSTRKAMIKSQKRIALM